MWSTGRWKRASDVSILPDSVKKVVRELASESSVKEIWLIGSRASGKVGAGSDWDLLVFSSEDPVVCPARSEGVDVLWKGPSGKVLLEGKPPHPMLDFSDFGWDQVSPERASYKGKRFCEFDGFIRDASEPVQQSMDCDGLLLWRRVGD